MNSHPNPKSVLVIGGGDGGVLREVVKHDTVETAVLCDIDEAVIRVSKKYLPGMSIGFQHPSVQTHVEDGFKFLADRKDEFDVIITDSGDPEGPAETLFQKPYFELMFGALKEGGVISTQGWPHCPRFFAGISLESQMLLILCFSSRKSVVAPVSDHVAQKHLPRSFPDCRICLHHDSNLSIWSNRVHDLLQGRQSGC